MEDIPEEDSLLIEGEEVVVDEISDVDLDLGDLEEVIELSDNDLGDSFHSAHTDLQDEPDAPQEDEVVTPTMSRELVMPEIVVTPPKDHEETLTLETPEPLIRPTRRSSRDRKPTKLFTYEKIGRPSWKESRTRR